MFKRLVSNLPFSPSLIDQIGFYADRLKRERTIRRLSFVFIALTLAVQSLAVFSPPERSLAASSNSIVSGGVSTRQSIIDAWNNDPTVPKIYQKFGVTLDDIKALPDKPNTKVRSNDGNDWWSVGRNSLTNYTNISDVYKNSQVAIKYDTNSLVYYRQLKAWDIRNPYNTYDAFEGTISKTGEHFWILASCGNLTKIGAYKEPPPKLDIRKTIDAPTQTLKPGDIFKFRFEYRNSKPDSVAKDVFITDQLDLKNFDIVTPKNLPITNGSLKYPVGNLMYTANYKLLNITVRLRNPLPTPTKICNTATLIASNASPESSDAGCINVINNVNPVPYNPPITNVNNPDSVKPKVVCKLVDFSLNRTTREVIYKTMVTTTNDKLVTIKSYNYDFGDGAKQLIKSSSLTNSVKHIYKPGAYTTNVVVSFTAPTNSGLTEQQISCSQSIDFKADQPLGQSKTVRNITKNLEGKMAIDTKVVAGDVLEYTLTTVNSQNYDRTGITIEDYVGDLLDYSTLDLVELKKSGGTFDKTTSKVSWNNVLIPANSQVNKSFRIKLLNPIPSTNSPTAVSTNFDCKISNQYGNEITLVVKCPVVKGIETIPDTGPGSSLITIAVITTIVGYFFARSRLLSKEMDLIKTDYATSGRV